MCRAMAADPEIHEKLPERHLRKQQLAATVRKIHWSYAFFWSISARQPGVLAWNDGYYNGQIKTWKTTQPIELKADQMGLQRSDQLRELYVSLLSGDCNQQTRRPSASLSPEDLTDTEWYYLVCMSFTFTLGLGLPGKALANNRHIWLNNAQFADSKIFSRSLLAKSASIQTVVCIPIMAGVLELGTTELILEDPALIKQITCFFWELPNPVCSEQAISSPQMAENDEEILCPNLDNDIDNSIILEDQNLITDCQTPLESGPTQFPFTLHSDAPTEHKESVQDKVGKELNAGSPDDSSNEYSPTQQLDDFFGIDGLHRISQTLNRQFIDDGISNDLHGSLKNEYVSMSIVNAQRVACYTKGERIRNQMLDSLQEGNHSKTVSLNVDGDDSHYVKTVSSILGKPKHVGPVSCSPKVSHKSSFVVWRRSLNTPKPFTFTPKKLLKKILTDRALLRGGCLLKHQEENGLQGKLWKPEVESGASHVLSERRREKLNEKFLVLRSIIPSISKVDKASVLSDTIAYLKDLERRVKELESWRKSAELDTRDRRKHPDVAERTSDNYGNKEITNGKKPLANKRKACKIDEAEAKHHWVFSKDDQIDVNVTMKEKEVVVEMHCPWRECLLLKIVESISNLHLDLLSVQSCTVDGILALTVKCKIRRTNVASPAMIKRSLQRVIRKYM